MVPRRVLARNTDSSLIYNFSLSLETQSDLVSQTPKVPAKV